MKTIASFTVNHDLLEKGMYVSRIDGDVVTYDVQEQAVSLSRIAEVEDVAELPVKAKAAGSCLVQLDLDTQDVAGTVNSIQSMSLPVARYSVDYHNAELSIYFWSLGGGFGE